MDRRENPSSGDRPRGFGPGGREWWALVELVGAVGLAVTQPALDLLANNVGILIAHDARPGEIFAVALALVTVPTLALYAIEVLGGLARPMVRPALHAALLAGLLGLFLAQLLWQVFNAPQALVMLVVALAVVLAFRWLRRAQVPRLYLRVLALGTVGFVVLFLVTPPVRGLIRHDPVGVAGARVANPTRVVMIVLDELPLETLLDGRGAIDRELFPNFARLADGSHWYRNATTVHGYTEWAVPAILSGTLPTDPEAVPDPAHYPDTIFSLLGGAYRMNVHESVERLCPSSVCIRPARPEGFVAAVSGLVREATDLWRDSLGPNTAPASPRTLPTTVSDRRQAMADFVSSLRPADDPVLDYLHLLAPHQPWRYLPTLQDATAPAEDPTVEVGNFDRWGSDTAARGGRQRHVLQVQAVDTFLGRVIDRLHRIDAWEDSLVVVTADHGAGFRVGEPIRWAVTENVHEILWTPLFVKGPGQAHGTVDDRPVETIDILPTVADVLDVDVPWSVDGHSARGSPRTDVARHFGQWDLRSPVAPDGVPTVPGGEFLEIDAESSFREVLTSRAVGPGPDPALRVYALGRYGAWIGSPTAPLVEESARARSTATVGDAARFREVDPEADSAPWSWIEGRISGEPDGTRLAVAVNGRLAGFTRVDGAGSGLDGYYLVVLAPSQFRAGPNAVEVFTISGPTDAPRLTPIRSISESSRA